MSYQRFHIALVILHALVLLCCAGKAPSTNPRISFRGSGGSSYGGSGGTIHGGGSHTSVIGSSSGNCYYYDQSTHVCCSGYLVVKWTFHALGGCPSLSALTSNAGGYPEYFIPRGQWPNTANGPTGSWVSGDPSLPQSWRVRIRYPLGLRPMPGSSNNVALLPGYSLVGISSGNQPRIYQGGSGSVGIRVSTLSDLPRLNSFNIRVSTIPSVRTSQPASRVRINVIDNSGYINPSSITSDNIIGGSYFIPTTSMLSSSAPRSHTIRIRVYDSQNNYFPSTNVYINDGNGNYVPLYTPSGRSTNGNPVSSISIGGNPVGGSPIGGSGTFRVGDIIPSGSNGRVVSYPSGSRTGVITSGSNPSVRIVSSGSSSMSGGSNPVIRISSSGSHRSTGGSNARITIRNTGSNPGSIFTSGQTSPTIRIIGGTQDLGTDYVDWGLNPIQFVNSRSGSNPTIRISGSSGSTLNQRYTGSGNPSIRIVSGSSMGSNPTIRISQGSSGRISSGSSGVRFVQGGRSSGSTGTRIIVRNQRGEIIEQYTSGGSGYRGTYGSGSKTHKILTGSGCTISC